MNNNHVPKRVSPNTRIEWASQAGGSYKKKRGTVIAFLPKSTSVHTYLPQLTNTQWPRDVGINLHGNRISHRVDRYLVLVDSNGKTKHYYTPVASVVETAKKLTT